MPSDKQRNKKITGNKKIAYVSSVKKKKKIRDPSAFTGPESILSNSLCPHTPIWVVPPPTRSIFRGQPTGYLFIIQVCCIVIFHKESLWIIKMLYEIDVGKLLISLITIRLVESFEFWRRLNTRITKSRVERHIFFSEKNPLSPKAHTWFS